MSRIKGKSFANWVIPTLPPSLLIGLPKPLEITDPIILHNSVTHSSLHGHPANANSLVPGIMVADYEKLEHIGDNIVGSAVTMISHDLYPWLKPGPCTVLRGQVCSNQVLSQLSVALGLPRKLLANRSQINHLRANPLIQAALFEAHIGALAVDGRVHAAAIDPILTVYLETIFEPIVRWAFDAMREYQQSLNDDGGSDLDTDATDLLAVGAKNTLDQYFVNSIKGSCTHEISKTAPFEAVFTVWIRRNGLCFETSAIRPTKKLASAAAAWEMCGKLGLQIGEYR